MINPRLTFRWLWPLIPHRQRGWKESTCHWSVRSFGTLVFFVRTPESHSLCRAQFLPALLLGDRSSPEVQEEPCLVVECLGGRNSSSYFPRKS